ncbi:MAG: 2-dehydropantoate 2-reductase [Cytophagaceae bacterium]|nr:2-dehydropantoate 2-reductase [Cytophagaceae bacterium]
MKFVIIGGTGAMGSIFGGRLKQAGYEVTLFDVSEEAVSRIRREGLQLTDKNNATETIEIPATTDPAEVGPVDVALVFVKCFHTQAAMRMAVPFLGKSTTVLSLQNGWGNAQTISEAIGNERLMIGVNYVSGTLLEPGHARQVGNPVAWIGRWGQPADPPARNIAEALTKAGFQTTASDNVLLDVWKKLALNVVTLPTAALLGFTAEKLIAHEPMMDVMRALLREMVTVAGAEGITLDFDERWDYITNLLQNAVGARGSMLQDVQARRLTEIDVINGAIAAAGLRHGIPTPVNDTMVGMVKAMEANYLKV